MQQLMVFHLKNQKLLSIVKTLNVQNVVAMTILTFVNLTLCSKLTKVQWKILQAKFTYVQKLRKVSSLTSKTFNVVCVKSYHLVLDKSVNHSVTKSHQVTLSFVLVNSNKWNQNSSVNQEQNQIGTKLGKITVKTSYQTQV